MMFLIGTLVYRLICCAIGALVGYLMAR